MKTITNKRRWRISNVLTWQFYLALALSGPGHAVGQDYAVLQSFRSIDGKLVTSGSAIYGSAPAESGWGWQLFKINADGTDYQVVKDFGGSNWRAGGRLMASGAFLYGATSSGGVSNCGTVFRINQDGSGYVLLKDFLPVDGEQPGAGVASGSTLFGTTTFGGISGYGTLFRVESDGTGFRVLKHFPGADGRRYPKDLVVSGMTLYGTTLYGGTSNLGTVFRLNADGTGFALLKQFTNANEGYYPQGIALSGTVLFGTTGRGGAQGCGTVFRINADGTGFTQLKSFTGGSDGGNPDAGPVVANGMVYGTTSSGAVSNGGTLFQMGLDGTGFTALTAFPGNSYSIPPSLVVSGGVIRGLRDVYEAAAYRVYGMLFALALPTDTPTLYQAPQNQVVAPGGQVSFQASAAGHPVLQYQWWRDGGGAIDSATNSVLQLTNVQPSQSGSYSLTITNDYGAITSPPVTLTVVSPGTVPVSVCSEVALRAALEGTGPVTFACDGAIRLGTPLAISADAILDGSGHQVTLSGRNQNRIFNVASNATLTLRNLNLEAGEGSEGAGGAIYNQGTVNATNCTFRGNSAWGRSAPPSPPGPGMPPTNGSSGWGGAILSLGALNISGCSFLENLATGGMGQMGQPGSLFGPINGGPAGGGGPALGGAVCSMGTMTLDASSFANNSVIGGAGGIGGSGLSYPCVSPGNGGSGGGGGSALGAALCTTGTSTVVNCTFAGNSAVPGTAGPGGSGGTSSCHGYTAHGANGPDGGVGPAVGGIYNPAGAASLTNCTLAFNRGGGMRIEEGTVMLVNTLLYTTGPGSNCVGRAVDLGHNISSDASCAFTNVGSLNNTDPRLAPLADNGGPTWTMALQWGSPAIDAGDTTSAPLIDQRGYARPLGLAADIGAFEYGFPVSLQASITPSGRVNIMVFAAPGQLCRLLASYDLVTWELFGMNIAGPDGTAFFQDDTKGTPQRFYRAVLP